VERFCTGLPSDVGYFVVGAFLALALFRRFLPGPIGTDVLGFQLDRDGTTELVAPIPDDTQVASTRAFRFIALKVKYEVKQIKAS
jgi:hypothetical protein